MHNTVRELSKFMFTRHFLAEGGTGDFENLDISHEVSLRTMKPLLSRRRWRWRERGRGNLKIKLSAGHYF